MEFTPRYSRGAPVETTEFAEDGEANEMPLESSLSEYVLDVVWFFLVGFVLENGFLRLQQLDHLAEFLRPYVT